MRPSLFLRLASQAAPVLLALTLSSQAAAAPEAALTVEHGNDRTTLTLDALRRDIPSQEMTVVNPDLGRSVRYLTLPLKDVLARAGVKEAEDLVFHCLDGYASNAPFSAVSTLDLRLAYGENGVPGQWTPIVTGAVVNDPAPFIVISPRSSDPKVFSWPFQMNRVEVVSFDRKYPGLRPVVQDGPVARGFAVYREQCLKCHALNQQGGEVGPELNVPRNITEYRDPAFLRAWLKDPSSFRARSRMPTLGLTAREIDDVIAYLGYMAGHKNFPAGKTPQP